MWYNTHTHTHTGRCPRRPAGLRAMRSVQRGCGERKAHPSNTVRWGEREAHPQNWAALTRTRKKHACLHSCRQVTTTSPPVPLWAVQNTLWYFSWGVPFSASDPQLSCRDAAEPPCPRTPPLTQAYACKQSTSSSLGTCTSCNVTSGE